MVAETVMF